MRGIGKPEREFNLEFGARIRARRCELGIGEKQFAESLSPPITRQYLWSLERGKNRVSTWRAVQISRLLETSIGRLCHRIEETGR